jgi:hypothetical protein
VAQPFSYSSARSTASIWPRTRLARFKSFSFSRLVWDKVDILAMDRVGGMVCGRARAVERWPSVNLNANNRG